jgi:hypothetical protein
VLDDLQRLLQRQTAGLVRAWGGCVRLLLIDGGRYRTSCGADGCDGIAFKQNGFQNLPGEVLPGSYGDGRLLSVGIREGAEVSRPFRVGWPEQGQLSGYDAQYDWYAQKPSPESLKPLQG